MKIKDLPWHILINGSIRKVLKNRQIDLNDSSTGRIYGKYLKLITKSTWMEYAILKDLAPNEPKIGNKILISVACIDLCLLNALKETAIEESYASSLVADINWNLMHKYLKFPIFLLNTFSRN